MSSIRMSLTGDWLIESVSISPSAFLTSRSLALWVRMTSGTAPSARDADAAVREDLRDRCEHARAVLDHETQVVARRDVVDRGNLLELFAGAEGRNPADRTGRDVERHVGDVGDDGARRRAAPGAAPVEERLADGVAFDHHAVEHV